MEVSCGVVVSVLEMFVWSVLLRQAQLSNAAQQYSVTTFSLQLWDSCIDNSVTCVTALETETSRTRHCIQHRTFTIPFLWSAFKNYVSTVVVLLDHHLMSAAASAHELFTNCDKRKHSEFSSVRGSPANKTAQISLTDRQTSGNYSISLKVRVTSVFTVHALIEWSFWWSQTSIDQLQLTAFSSH